ncbi:MAG TPA: flagellar basal body P-ring protein FlgI [Buchnera sp. (in: enterobacteria)]|nr:flagellar basal body P-ring protein FlgI [Buchnera sp. (in: enterobacteria)]
MIKNIFLKVYIILLSIFITVPAYSDKIRDITTLQGFQENKLIGYGLVVGLNGTGDETRQSPVTNQSLSGMLSRLGISVSSSSAMNPKNTAAVMVTATLPNFSYIGQKMDVHVSSIGTAKSLEGGTLLMTPLRASDNKIYATAQGQVLIKEKKNKNINFFYFQLQKQNFNSGKIILGATVQRKMNNEIELEKGSIYLQLNEEDFSTSQKISDCINEKFFNIATPIDARTIQVTISKNPTEQIKMISKIQNIDVFIPVTDAKIIINSKTGTVVSNGDIKINACNLSNKKMSIIVNEKVKKNYKKNLDLFITDKNYLINQENKFNSYNSNLINIIRALQSLGTAPDELIFILKSMKNAGCINAKLEIL